MEKLLEFLSALVLFVLNRPELLAPIIIFVLASVPGQFKTLAEAVVKFLLEQAKTLLEGRKRYVISDAVAMAEQIGFKSSEKKALAMNHAVAFGIAASEASARIEAEVQRLPKSALLLVD
jgi:hypothetical protein